jgi:hypothetical protein
MKPEDILLKISDSFASGANEGRQFIIVNELLGKAQTDLIKLLNQGSESITQQGEALGVFSDETIAQLSQASDAFKKLESTITIVFGTIAALINPAIEAFQDFVEELTLLGAAALEFGKGNFGAAGELAKMGAPGAASRRRQAEGKPQPIKRAAESVVSLEEQDKLIEEKRKQDKSLFDEELYNLKEEAELEAARDKTLFDRMIRDAEFERDEKKRILALEKETAEKNKEMVERGMEAAGTILDRVRAAAMRRGEMGVVQQVDVMRQKEQQKTDVDLLERLGPRGIGGKRSAESISALTGAEGNLERQQNDQLFKTFEAMQGLVGKILGQMDNLGVPILKSAS